MSKKKVAKKKTIAQKRALITRFDNYFNASQQAGIANGLLLTKILKDWTLEAVGVNNPSSTKRHWYIYGPPGTSKTYTVSEAIAKSKRKVIQFEGSTSMSAFVIDMAVAQYDNPTKQKTVWIDDCDSFFTDKKHINVMKGVLDGDRNVLGYNVNMTNQIAQYRNAGNEKLADCLESFQNGGVGLAIPMDTFSFIVTSNKPLAPQKESLQSQKKMDEYAVRDRVKYKPLNIKSKDEAWGWVAQVALSEDIFKVNGFSLTDEKLKFLLDTFYANWDDLSSSSIRSFLEAGAVLHARPKTFLAEFKQTFTE